MPHLAPRDAAGVRRPCGSWAACGRHRVAVWRTGSPRQGEADDEPAGDVEAAALHSP